MSTDDKRRAAARAAVDHLDHAAVVGVGAGAAVDYFIAELGRIRARIDAAVASSAATTGKLKAAGIPVVDLNRSGDLEIYVDGCAEVNRYLQLVTGGGGAREKVIAAASRRFLCIADDSQLVDVLGGFGLAVEILPMARSYVARRLVKLGGRPAWRENVITEDGNELVDVTGLSMVDPGSLERELNNIPGVVSVGLHALRPADVLLLGGEDRVQVLT